MNIEISIVVPCYNESDCIDELYSRLSKCMANNLVANYEIILVNDGSTDDTWKKISSFAQENTKIVGINLSRNHGHQVALTAGLSFTKGKRILIIDADLQDPPELFPQMNQLMNDGYDVVYGKRAERNGETHFKKVTASFFYRFINRLSDTYIPNDTGDFRLISKRALKVFLSMPEEHRFIRGMVSWIGFPQTAIEYDRDPRFSGETKYPLSKMLSLATDAITGFSTKPLKIAFKVSFLFALISFVLSTVIVLSWLNDDVVPGWTSLSLIILMIGSIQMFTIGLIGEYLGRLYMQSKNRPLFIIQDKINID